MEEFCKTVLSLLNEKNFGVSDSEGTTYLLKKDSFHSTQTEILKEKLLEQIH